MADATTFIELLVSSGVLGLAAKASGRLWIKLIDRPLEKAEARAEKAERRAEHLAEELKVAADTATTLRRMLEIDETGTPSVPPPPRHRKELPTFTAIVDLRREAAYAQEAERARQRPLNPSSEGIPTTAPLDAFGGKRRLPRGAGHADYDGVNVDDITPTEIPRRKK